MSTEFEKVLDVDIKAAAGPLGKGDANLLSVVFDYDGSLLWFATGGFHLSRAPAGVLDYIALSNRRSSTGRQTDLSEQFRLQGARQCAGIAASKDGARIIQ